MRNVSLNPVEILNASVQLTLRVASPWMGVLWITALPLRLLQLYFVTRIAALDEPQYYMYYLWRVTAVVFAAFLVSLYGRAVYARACHHAQNALHGSQLDPLKVPLSDLIPYMYAALINELFFYATLFTMLMPPLFIIYGGLAAATSTGTGGPKLLDAVLSPFKALRVWKALLINSLVFPLCVFLAFINLYILIILLLWAFGSLLGSDLPRWEYIIQHMPNLPHPQKGDSLMDILRKFVPDLPLTFWLIGVGAWMIVEPFWLAANVALIQKARTRKSGEDLRIWFQDLKKGVSK